MKDQEVRNTEIFVFNNYVQLILLCHPVLPTDKTIGLSRIGT
ncbi:hypothetical protein SR1949_01920 [Sphaerospermopsis reniformis]|uniref:Uncharacterized protein n=1 Tax=Sphaerospermopsis reniformis TaxID=531300 RepID=A0A479ZQX7_9CYAN|nr:hypothetical protein NIES73_49660 [Sphaerospermopsis kisseleviana NIES-73]GCL35100.1 hypothetical protein SR1949_01920 [Sphaerospermopsis reniformis]